MRDYMNHKNCNTKQQVVGILWAYVLNFLAANGLLELRGLSFSSGKHILQGLAGSPISYCCLP